MNFNEDLNENGTSNDQQNKFGSIERFGLEFLLKITKKCYFDFIEFKNKCFFFTINVLKCWNFKNVRFHLFSLEKMTFAP